MRKTYRSEQSPSEIVLQTIISSLDDVWISQTLAIKLVGGYKTLLGLHERGKVRMAKRTNRQNSKWDCNAADVLLNVKGIWRQSEKARTLALKIGNILVENQT